MCEINIDTVLGGFPASWFPASCFFEFPLYPPLPPFPPLLQAKNKLKTKKLKSAKLDSTGAYLADLDSVPDDALVLVSTNPPPRAEAPHPAGAGHGEVTFSAAGTERKPKDVGGKLFDQVGGCCGCCGCYGCCGYSGCCGCCGCCGCYEILYFDISTLC